MYVSDAVWFKRKQKKKIILRKIAIFMSACVLLVFFCACGVCIWQEEESGVAEAADVQSFSDNSSRELSESAHMTGVHNYEYYMKEEEKEELDKIVQEPLIIIDAGHGGEDEGCNYSEVNEKDLNLELAYMLKSSLENKGLRVVLTREGDEQISLQERVEVANEAKGDLFISIHQNASEDKSVHGIETWYCKEGNAENERFAKLVQQYVVLYSKEKDRGIVDNDTLYVTRECNMPSCLLEVGFLSNEQERNKIITQEYKEKIIQGMTDAVELYLYPKKMYLTFDDGPSEENTMKILDVLKEENVKATFFVVGENVEKHPEVAKRIVEDGHTIGIHCYNHSYDNLYESAESYLADFEKAKQVVYEVTGVEAWCFRFPGGSINSHNEEIYEEIIEEMTKRGYIYFDWNASLEDAVKKTTPEQLIQNAKESTLQRKRVVMLAHDIVYNTTLCLEELLKAFPEYEFLPITKDTVTVQF